MTRRFQARLTERQEQVLAAIIAEHVRTGEPVGSKTACARYSIAASSATIRNDMVVLTERGLIEQPHTSAGRLPTDRGYRYYVEHLMGDVYLGSREAAWIKGEFRRSADRAEDIVREAARLLSSVLHWPAVVMSPRRSTGRLEHFHASPVSATNVLLVCVTADGEVENRLVEMPAPVTSQQLERMSEILNERFAGLEIGALSRMDVRAVQRELGSLSLPPGVLRAIQRALEQSDEHDVYVEGVIYVLQDPRFARAAELQRIVETLYRQRVLQDLLRPAAQQDRVCIRIGAENKLLAAHPFGVVAMSYVNPAGARGVVAALGPKRMPYWRAVPAVECVADELSEHLAGDPPEE